MVWKNILRFFHSMEKMFPQYGKIRMPPPSRRSGVVHRWAGVRWAIWRHMRAQKQPRRLAMGIWRAVGRL